MSFSFLFLYFHLLTCEFYYHLISVQLIFIFSRIFITMSIRSSLYSLSFSVSISSHLHFIVISCSFSFFVCFLVFIFLGFP